MDPVAVTIHGIAAGGDGVGRLADGRAVFVRGAIPGDVVSARVDEEKPRFARATAVAVLEPGPGRQDPPCPHVAEGCGGCGWQHVDLAVQHDLKATIVTDALTRIGRLAAADLPPVDPGPALAPAAYRTTVRAAVAPDGRLGLRTHRGHDVVAFGEVGCPVAHPLVDEVLRSRRFPGATEVTVRCGATTGDVLVDVDGVPERPWFHDVVAGRRYRVSAGSFFQTRADGAAALVEVVADALAGALERGAPVADLYGGVGLLGGGLADRLGVEPTLVESNRSAADDARVNLADVAGSSVVKANVERWRPAPFDAVVADPARHGLGAAAVERIAATGAEVCVLVSCDPGSLGRDAGLLAAAGYGLAATTLVDLFPHTPHVEVVTRWVIRPDGPLRTPTAHG